MRTTMLMTLAALLLAGCANAPAATSSADGLAAADENMAEGIVVTETAAR